MTTKILSVDDSSTIRWIVTQAFRPYDVAVLEGANGEEGLAIAAREKPDVILLDVTMPVMDGVTMLGALKKNPDLRQIPVVMLTAESGRGNILEIARMGVRDYLVKPFKEEQLVQKVSRIIPLQKTPLQEPILTEVPDYEEAARRYGLEPIPESVLRLTQLVARQDADLEEIAAFINKDAALSRRILRMANPHAGSQTEYEIKTVEDALMRNGIGCALLLGMSAPLSEALVKTFNTMLSLKLESLDSCNALSLKEEHMVGSIGFSGRAGGQIFLRLSSDSAKQIAGRVRGLEPKELPDPAATRDAVGEVLNIVAGNFKSNLCDAGLECCRLEPPRVFTSKEFKSAIAPGSGIERMAFHAEPILLFVEARVNPWG